MAARRRTAAKAQDNGAGVSAEVGGEEKESVLAPVPLNSQGRDNDAQVNLDGLKLRMMDEVQRTPSRRITMSRCQEVCNPHPCIEALTELLEHGWFDNALGLNNIPQRTTYVLSERGRGQLEQLRAAVASRAARARQERQRAPEPKWEGYRPRPRRTVSTSEPLAPKGSVPRIPAKPVPKARSRAR